MRVLFDGDVLVDAILEKDKSAMAMVELVQSRSLKGAVVMSDIAYIYDKLLVKMSSEKARSEIDKILGFMHAIVPGLGDYVKSVYVDDDADMRMNLYLSCAVRNRCDVILTNRRVGLTVGVRMMTPVMLAAARV